MKPIPTKMWKHVTIFVAIGSVIAFIINAQSINPEANPNDPVLVENATKHLPAAESFARDLNKAALKRTEHVVRYVADYVGIPYPNGDVPADTGVCTDEVIRAYRMLGFDLQTLVHEDMKNNFSRYPKIWDLRSTDKNIDHRRVPNLQVFFKRQGAELPVTQNADDYLPGDLITCLVAQKLPHIALVVPNPHGEKRPWIVHNIGRGPMLEDALFSWPLTGHYRYHPKK